jgi:16S rRNA (guanine(966)-N(2))-methyltransferase RsmD
MDKRKQGKPARPPVAHQVRIIGGQWKRTPLAVPDAPGLRPTPDRVRETLFNWLNHLLGGEWDAVRCLDLFAGTGALGFEAASRGAAQVRMVESSPAALRQLEASRDKLGAGQVSIFRGDALAAAHALLAGASQDAGRFDLIFLDPPYQQDWLPKILPLCAGLLADGGMVYAEAEQPLSQPPGSQPSGAAAGDAGLIAWMDGWTAVRSDKAGMVYYHLLKRSNSP